MSVVVRCALMGALLVWSAVCVAAPTASPFEAANGMAYKGDYVGAAAAYEAIVATGMDDPALYHNMGNAYFHAEAFGQAVWAYRRGLQCAPNADLRDGLVHNLKAARSALQTRYRASNDGSQFIYAEPGGWLFQLTHSVTLEGLVWGFLFVWWFLLVCLVGRRVARGRGWGSAAVPAVVLVALVGTMLAGRLATDASFQLGVVVSDGVVMREGPDVHARGVDAPEGMEVRVLDVTEEWQKIEVPSGRAGWVTTASLRPL
jgi:hypothetical protein